MGGPQETSESPLRNYGCSEDAKGTREHKESPSVPSSSSSSSSSCGRGGPKHELSWAFYSPNNRTWGVSSSHSSYSLKPSLKVLLTSCIVLMFGCTVQGEDKCSSNIMCYECSSWTHPLCEDPFNFTLPVEKGPPSKACDGCCVKLVQHIGTPYASIRRTCTKNLRINLFVVDHVCMMEGGGRGHMCFCEEDYCNAAPPSFRSPRQPWAPLLLLLVPPMLLHALLAWDPR